MANTVKVGITATDEGFKSSLDQMSRSANNFGNSLSSSGNKFKSLNAQLREAKREATNLALAYDQLDAAAKQSDFGRQMKAQLDQALNAAGRLQDIRSDVQQNIKNIASDTMAWDATAQGIQVVSSGLQGLASVYGLLGGDVQKFAQALVAVNAVQSVANTIIGIGNALQKQSALMVGLRAAKNAIFGASEVAVTAAETANTTATSANTAATGANTAAKGANAGANAAQTTSLVAATGAQLANNAAVLANPYVLCAVAVAALTAAIVAWVVSMDDATESEMALNAATEAYEQELDSNMKTAGEQISTFNSLKKVYDECGGNVDVLKKKIIDNTEAQRKLGVVVKTVDDVHKLFGKNSGAYCNYAYARARAMAAEAAQAAILGEVLAELTKIQAKMMRGEEVDYVDFKKILNKAGLSDSTINTLVKDAGGKIEWDYIWSNLDDSAMDWGKFMNSAMDKIMTNGAGKYLQQMISDANAEMDVASADFSDLLEKNNKKMKDGAKHTDKHSKAAKKGAKETEQELNKVLTTLEGCDNTISEAEKQMKKLDSTSKTYAADMKKIQDLILVARMSKLQLLDKTTITGLSESKSLIEQILKSIPANSPAAAELNKQLGDINNKLYGMYAALAQNGDVKSLKNARTQVEAIIETLPEGSDELRTWVAIWTQLNEKIVVADRRIDNLKKGIQENSKTWLEQQIKDLQNDIDNTDITVNGNMLIVWNKQEEIRQLKGQLGKINELTAGISVPAKVKIDTTLDYKKSPIEKIERDIEEYSSALAELQQITEESVSPETFKQVSDEINDLQHKIGDLNKQKTFIEITNDVKEFEEQLRDSAVDTIKGFVDGLHTIYNVATELPDKLDECKNGFEGFFEVMDAGFSIFDSIMSFIDNINKMVDVINVLTGAKAALNLVEQTGIGTKTGEALATEAQAAAEGKKATADGTAIGESLAKTAAMKEEEAALLDLAAAQIFAAHSSIPFAGVGIASGLVGAMMAAMTAQHTAAMGLQAFEHGGIVKGSTTMGDNVLVRANAGEMFLDTTQQKRLFDFIDHGVMNNNGQITVSHVRVQGSDLILAIKNYQKIHGKQF